MRRLILASRSPARQALLRGAGLDFITLSADLDEAGITRCLLADGKDASTIALHLAEQKALKISQSRPGDLVLGGDSVLVLGSELIGKSPDLKSLRALLVRLSGKTHRLISAASLAEENRPLWHHVAHADLTMRRLGEEFIDDYLAREGEALLGSVGGYHLEGLGAQLFETVAGDYFTTLGLPLLPVLKELRALGWLLS